MKKALTNLNINPLKINEAIRNYKLNGFGILHNVFDENFVYNTKDQIETILKDETILQDFYKHLNKNKTEFITDTKLTSEDYYLESGDKIRLFIEPTAIDEFGELKHSLNKSINKIGHCLHDLNPFFKNLSYSPLIKDIIKHLGYKKPIIVQSMYIFKNSYVSSPIPPHTDNMFLRTRPSSCMVKYI
jgi:phytanoyl-CoA hydroxylase